MLVRIIHWNGIRELKFVSIDWNRNFEGEIVGCLSFQDILTRLSEIPPEKPGMKRVSSRGSAGIQSNTEPVDTDWMTDEFLADLDRQKVIVLPSIMTFHQNHQSVYFRWN